jgi:Pentapeptide repeats (8 copies)
MPRRIISQPLPIDLRNWSFRGMDCVGWDFEGRDIRGCDFTNARLNQANFKQVVAGRSQKQSILDAVRTVAIVLLLAAPVAIAFLTVFIWADVVVFGFDDYPRGVPTASQVVFVYAVAIVQFIASVTGFMGTVVLVSKIIALRSKFTPMSVLKKVLAGTLVGTFVGAGLLSFLLFSDRSEHTNQTLEFFYKILGCGFGAVAIVCLVVSYILTRSILRAMKNSTGTTFKGASLSDANFSNAILNNCNFDQAAIDVVNWSD